MHSHIPQLESEGEIKARLKAAGLKATSARVEIIALMNKAHVPMRAEDVSKRLKGKKADAATIYRTLGSLEQAGIARRVDLRGDSAYFELSNDHHHHLVCQHCGLIEDFDLADESLINSVLKKSSRFKSVTDHSFELFGLCVKCAKK